MAVFHSKVTVLLRTQDFSYELPEKLIAQRPLSRRENSRLICYQDKQVAHKIFSDLPNLIPDGALILLNDTKVFHARIFGNKEGSTGKIEIFLLQLPTEDKLIVKAFARPRKRLKEGTILEFGHGLKAQVIELPIGAQTVSLQFFSDNEGGLSWDGLLSWLEEFGHVPLPQYIKRSDEIEDQQRYQSVFGTEKGSVAAPTASLHFTQDLLDQLKQRGIRFAHVTLHVGAGTFAPVKHDDLNMHPMHSEHYMMPKETLEQIKLAKKEKRPIYAVGTTVFRAVESFFINQAEVDSFQSTRLFVFPKSKEDRYKPHVADFLITNFHQPRSTLFMLVCAVLGYDKAHALYAEARIEGYRFLSYGDACLLDLHS